MQALIAKNVICDFRAPDVVRFGITPLYQKYQDVWDAVAILTEILATESWQKQPSSPTSAVT